MPEKFHAYTNTYMHIFYCALVLCEDIFFLISHTGPVQCCRRFTRLATTGWSVELLF